MSIVSYRVRCTDCDAETVLQESEVRESDWSVGSLYKHTGRCPRCNPAMKLSESEWEPEPDTITLEELDNIGATAAQNLREAGYDTDIAIAEASEEELLDVSWVGQKGLVSLKEAVNELEPQKRWEENE